MYNDTFFSFKPLKFFKELFKFSKWSQKFMPQFLPTGGDCKGREKRTVTLFSYVLRD